MIPERLKKIVTLLRDKTSEKKAIWNKTSGQDEYKLQIGEGSSIVVSFDYGNYNSEYITISIFNKNGDMVERYDNENEQDEDSSKLLWSFHKAARDSYYKVEETMEHLLNEISKQDVVGIKEEKKIIPPAMLGDDDDLPF
ncbi:hypothetical protein [Pedobacter sp. P26]|uniref:hypothetical protein n=1 Tax=Pedobacter sp. P26 TaxID=3423956 RepID=UPI003D66FE7B